MLIFTPITIRRGSDIALSFKAIRELSSLQKLPILFMSVICFLRILSAISISCRYDANRFNSRISFETVDRVLSPLSNCKWWHTKFSISCNCQIQLNTKPQTLNSCRRTEPNGKSFLKR